VLRDEFWWRMLASSVVLCKALRGRYLERHVTRVREWSEGRYLAWS
jgi:hypothetical protein